MSDMPVQVICDLRNYNKNIDDPKRMQVLWDKISNQLVGKTLVKNQAIELQLESDKIALWIVENRGIAQVLPQTTFAIVDILRSPRLFYRCQICGEYGPLRCVECVKEKRPEGKERLCTHHAHFIQDRMSAYCPEHKPLCSCRMPSCQQPAVFACTRCKNLFGDHYRKAHPRNPDIEYCQRCYRILFERCSACQKIGKFGLGHQRCSYKTWTRPDEICGDALCWDHAYQWKVWGPQNRGIIFCEKHKQLLSNTDPADMLFILLTANAPRQSGRYMSLNNVFLVRRLLNRNRAVPLTLEQVGNSLHAIAPKVESWGQQARNRYDSIMKSLNETITLQQNFLRQIQDFYRRELGKQYAQQIVTINITDSFVRQNQGKRYNIDLYLYSDQKRPFVGRGGELIKSLEAQLNARLKFWYYNNGNPREL